MWMVQLMSGGYKLFRMADTTRMLECASRLAERERRDVVVRITASGPPGTVGFVAGRKVLTVHPVRYGAF